MIFKDCDNLNELECACRHGHGVSEIIRFEFTSTAKLLAVLTFTDWPARLKCRLK
jgi:hypothetical protein